MNYRKVLGVVIILLPYAIFGAIYFLLGKWPNYLFGEIDIEGIYNLEKELFGVTLNDGTRVTLQEYFRDNHWTFMDILSGLLYLCWMPVPVLYTLVLYFQHREDLALRLSCAFLMVNLIGFCGYYIHPASPPWYVMEYGFEPIFNTPGNEAGFANFDKLTGIGFFHGFYCNNANVFAAVPSLHSAYNVIAFAYAMKVKGNLFWKIFTFIVTIGICFSAIYSAHHYTIDVILGVLTAIIGITIFEKMISHIKVIKKTFNGIVNVIKLR